MALPAPGQARPRFLIGGEEQPRLGDDLISLELSEPATGVALRAEFNNLDAEGFRHFEDTSLRLGRAIAVRFDETTGFGGAITALGARFPEAEPPSLLLEAEPVSPFAPATHFLDTPRPPAAGALALVFGAELRSAELRASATAQGILITGTALLDGPPGLRVGAAVELRGLGPWFSGVYDVTALRHVFEPTLGLRCELGLRGRA